MENQVKQFHETFDFPVGLLLSSQKSKRGDFFTSMAARILSDCSAMLLSAAKEDVEDEGDHRLYRLHGLVEELAEIATAMHETDIVALADGLSDLLYWLVGAAVAYNIPIDECFEEVHRSNMTKSRNSFRMRDKGEAYIPPDLAPILRSRGHVV